MTADADIRPLLDHAVPFALVAGRIAGLFVLTPMLTSVVIPARHKAILATMLAAAAYPIAMVHVKAPAVADVWSLLPMLAGEGLIGITMGLLASIPLVSMEMAGVVAGQTMGFGLARVYNPEIDADADVLGQILMFIATGLYASVGGLERLFTGVLGSFERVPLGAAGLNTAPLDLALGVLQSGVELALRVSMPVVGICLLIVVVLGVIGKAMPAFNVMSIGFTIKLIAGVLVLALSLSAVGDALHDDVESALRTALNWAQSLGTGAH